MNRWEQAPLEEQGASPMNRWEQAPLADEAEPQGGPDYGGALLGGLNTGVASLLGLPGETAKNVVNLGRAAYGTAVTAAGRPDLAPDVIAHLPGDMQTFTDLGKKAGLTVDNPNPEDRTSRIIHGTGAGIGSSAGGPASGVRRAVTELVKTATAGAAAGTGAATAHEIAPESRTAPLLGAIVPAVGVKGVQAGTRGFARGGETGRKAMENELLAFKDARAEPSLGQATKNTLIRGGESMLASTPGSAGFMAKRAEQLSDDLGAGVKTATERLTTKTGADVAGNAIKAGISGPDGFIDQFKATYRGLDDEVVRHISPDLRITPQATATTLERLTTPIQGAENVSGVLANPKVAGIHKQLAADLEANNGAMPYQALKKLRTKVGSMLQSSELISDVPKAELKQLYGALTDDMRTAATQAGPPAIKAFERANHYYAAGSKRIEDHLNSITSKVDAEDIYKAAMSGTKEGASRLRAVKRSLGPDQFRVVAATTFNRLGRAKDGKQNDLGERFSSETFLSKWNELDPGARRELLSGYPGGDRIEQALNATAKVATNVRDGSKVWANPSGTSGALISKAGFGGLAYTVATGQFQAAGIILGGMGLANVTARTLTNPKLIRWIAEGTKLPVSELAPHLTRLTAIAARLPEGEEKEEAEQLLEATKQQLNAKAQ